MAVLFLFLLKKNKFGYVKSTQEMKIFVGSISRIVKSGIYS